MNKHELMAQLRAEAESMLAESGPEGARLVWGEGSLDARLVLVGEAPGAEEERVGRPFVGQAGRFLDSELARAGIDRDAVYITNVVKFRPRHPQGNRNRRPTPAEVRSWRDLLLREIEVISPEVVLCLGAVAASALIHRGCAMSAERGKWFEGPFGIRVVATFHPAYVRRFRGDERLVQFREDIIAAALGCGRDD